MIQCQRRMEIMTPLTLMTPCNNLNPLENSNNLFHKGTRAVLTWSLQNMSCHSCRTLWEQLCHHLSCHADENKGYLLCRDYSVLIFNVLRARALSSPKVSHFMGFLLHQVFVGSSACFALPACLPGIHKTYSLCY